MRGLPARLLAGLIVFLLFWVAAWAEVAVPPLKARVTDLTGTLSASQQAELERTLQAFEARKGSQIGVLILPTTKPEEIEQYAIRVAEKWKLGRKSVDDGAILLLATEDRALRIEVGYGLEGALNDATAKRIISETMVPKLKAGDVYGAVRSGVETMIRVIDGEPLPEPKNQAARGQAQRGSGGIGQFLPVAIVLALAVGGVMRSVLGRFPGALVTGGITALAGWLLMGALSLALLAAVAVFFFTLLGGGMGGGGGWSNRGGFPGGFGGGGFGGGGGGGGGFGGGGGGFGGGGASGRW